MHGKVFQNQDGEIIRTHRRQLMRLGSQILRVLFPRAKSHSLSLLLFSSEGAGGFFSLADTLRNESNENFFFLQDRLIQFKVEVRLVIGCASGLKKTPKHNHVQLNEIIMN